MHKVKTKLLSNFKCSTEHKFSMLYICNLDTTHAGIAFFKFIVDIYNKKKKNYLILICIKIINYSFDNRI